MANCVYCGKTTDLNTSITITLDDGTKIAVDICDEHAEDATIKSAKIAFMDKKKQIDALLEQAAALGLKLVDDRASGLVIMKQESQPKRSPQGARQEDQRQKPVVESIDDPSYVSTDIVDSRSPKMPRITGSAPGVENYGSNDLNMIKGKLPENALKGQAKIGVFEGRQGQPIALVEQRRDGLGTTNVKIINKENDKTLQERFKRMADNSQRDDNGVFFAKEGYGRTFTDCSLCRGAGTVRNGKMDIVCPKCHGSGILELT